ncbi:MAG: cation:proton antiporter [Flavobacteriaceae bacterium]|nr:cation:proton antiporter [Flavobacteriaceae bacterium]
MEVNFIVLLAGFVLVAIAGQQIAKVFQKIKFPLITGLIITGILAGSSFLNFIPSESLPKLNFLNNLALAIIAFSAGAEFYLKELRSRINSIKWMTASQLFITVILSTWVIFEYSLYIPFMQDQPKDIRLIIALLFGVIFVARSPSSAIAVINEMRANGPFTKTSMGVTVVKDVLVIILFAVCFSTAKTVINNEDLDLTFLIFLTLDLTLSFFLGIVIGLALKLPLSLKINKTIKAIGVLLIGYGVYVFAELVRSKTAIIFGHEIVLEPLLVCIIGSFYITNYTNNRIEFVELLEEISPTIYVIFFTLTGASLSFQTLIQVLWIAIAFFCLRLFSMFLAGMFGVLSAKDEKKFLFISWMPYVTQAGVALGLTTIIANEFTEWGYEFQTIIIAIIVINQLIGPVLFKISIDIAKESHLKHKSSEFDGIKDAIIFGLESQSIALAMTLKQSGWVPKIITFSDIEKKTNDDFEIIQSRDISLNSLGQLSLEGADAIVCLLSDKENYKIANLVYEHYGTKDVIVRYNGAREYYERLINIGVRIIDPSLAMINLLDHFVRSPNATSLLLGLDNKKDSVDVQIRNKDIHGMTLRDLRFPTDVIVLSVVRKGQVLISHGYTRLRLGDFVTLVGTKESVENVRFKLES